MAIGEVYRATVCYSHSGTEFAMVTWHFRMLSTADPETTIGLYLKTYFVDLLKTKQCNTIRCEYINGLRVNASPPVSWQYTTGMPITASLTGEEPAHQTAVVVTHKTQYAGRSYRGRHFLPGINEAGWLNGLLDPTVRTALQTYYDDIVAAVGASGANTDIRWVVWSQRLLTSTDVKDTIVREVPGQVRRRRVGVGI